MVKYLFEIFYLCVVMFLNLGHQLAKGETCGDGRRGNARYMNANKTEVDHQLISFFSYYFFCLISATVSLCCVGCRPNCKIPIADWLSEKICTSELSILQLSSAT